MSSQLTALLKEVTEQYMKWSPHELSCETVNKFINGVQLTKPDRNKVDSTGICYLVATFVKDYMKQHYATDVEFFFIWREFDPEYGEDEDSVLHAGIYFEGRYYDTYNPGGVVDIKELIFYQNQSAPHMLFTKHDPDWIQFGKDAFTFSEEKEDKFISYLKEVLP